MLLSRLKPLGSAPETMLHVKGGTPPLSVSVYEYFWPATAAGRFAGLFATGGGTAVAASELDFVLSATDVAVTMNCTFAFTAAGAV